MPKKIQGVQWSRRTVAGVKDKVQSLKVAFSTGAARGAFAEKKNGIKDKKAPVPLKTTNCCCMVRAPWAFMNTILQPIRDRGPLGTVHADFMLP
jgi:hypothetical protein